ncbi:LCP family protein [Anaerocolumna xylanovorans]|uniref:Transcriptional attenuator, LytR family n=1 Tax=Anaerocolumna xylanovorans DSM 12503 TaxID=1121345 RepID=A0A1M7YB02_9FIRM|nr:LCP family protein [Anaerocolumna xylanovorans]SHO49793.1 transcriptional attenuator, LytR family [Anaerocolumna xylanovorans DSM 12503]
MQKSESDTDTKERYSESPEDPLGVQILIRGQEDELLNDITESLKEQVAAEMAPAEKAAGQGLGKGKRKRLKIFLGAAVMVFAVILILFATPLGRGFLFDAVSGYAYGKMAHDDRNTIKQQLAVPGIAETTVTPAITETPVGNEENQQEDNTVNILLLGEEAIDSGSADGRTDIMIIATLDKKEKCIKITSLMRDMLVQIPGFRDNKLNAAYEYGGVPLLYDTLYENFGIRLDGYMLVGFNTFENVIDKLGGVTITLTRKEADYLNSTNYISKEKYRNVVAGSQVLNGNQALGYCRVRYVEAGNHEFNDFGRTSRQRTVLNAIYEKYKTKSLPELALLANGILPDITTDLTQEQFTDYLKELVEIKGNPLQTLRIPADNTYDVGTVREMSVLIPDMKENASLLKSFINETEETETP